MRRSSLLFLLVGASWAGLALGSPDDEPEPELVDPMGNQASTEMAGIGHELSQEDWLRTTSAMESRSTAIAEAAGLLGEVTAEIEASGRLSRLTQLATLAIDLEREIVRSNLAAENLDKP